jgi:hypothetical protein
MIAGSHLGLTNWSETGADPVCTRSGVKDPLQVFGLIGLRVVRHNLNAGDDSLSMFSDLRSGLLIVSLSRRVEMTGSLFCRVLLLLVEVSELVHPVATGRATSRANAAASWVAPGQGRSTRSQSQRCPRVSLPATCRSR